MFDDAIGRPVDIDMRSTEAAVMDRFAISAETPQETEPSYAERALSSANDPENSTAADQEPRSRGRPKLGVIPREVTLLPRHWEWLAEQPGGASVALRKLVEAARKANSDQERVRKSHIRAYFFMSAIAGDLPRFEEATRALFGNDQARFINQIAEWPVDVREYATWLAFSDSVPTIFSS